jgi:hypothetical protein
MSPTRETKHDKAKRRTYCVEDISDSNISFMTSFNSMKVRMDLMQRMSHILADSPHTRNLRDGYCEHTGHNAFPWYSIQQLSGTSLSITIPTANFGMEKPIQSFILPDALPLDQHYPNGWRGLPSRPSSH